MRWLALGFLALVACETPTPSLRIRLTDGPTQACGSLDCREVPLACTAWMSIRIIDPADPLTPYLSQCVEVPRTGDPDMCSLARVDLETKELPLTDLEVQVAIYPESMITVDPVTGEDVCPSETQYDAVNGFPIESDTAPALGGRAFYRPGDEAVIVTLGCTDLEAVNDPVCVGIGRAHVAATVDDFDTGDRVEPTPADTLNVAVGEPEPSNGGFALNPGDLTVLERTVRFPPAWAADVDHLFMSYACVSVLDDAAQSTTTVTCQPADMSKDVLEFTGSRDKPAGVTLSTASLNRILTTVGLVPFPSEGVTIGIVVDEDGIPVANQVVAAPPGVTIQYLSSDRTSVIAGATSGGTLGGVFVSADAPFGTELSAATTGPIANARALAGRIRGKVTIAILKLREPPIGGGE